MAKLATIKPGFDCKPRRWVGGRLRLLIAALWLAPAASMVAQDWQKSPSLHAPDPAEEFRGVWIATVYNIDWPSKAGGSPASQQAELIVLLDLAAAANLNAVVLQVRSMSDAFFESSLEPWSKFLTGKNGQPPSPRWDPLAFAVDAAHARGLELHAWFNPFRAGVSGVTDVAANHITKTHPGVVRQAGSTKWLDPTSPFVRNRAIEVIVDVVRRYHVDGVHIDDYFYPYPHNGGGDNFDDLANWQSYQKNGGKLEKPDWRREQVNSFIQEFYRRVKSTKTWVKVGVSPFGIWRPGVPAGIEARLDAYDHIYADSKKWLNQGWIDYFSPQLYWKIEGPQAFKPLFHWWQTENTHGRHLWPGISVARIGTSGEGDGRNATEVANQIDISRGSPTRPAKPAPGNILWSISALKKNAGNIHDELRKKTNRSKALVPASPWLSQRPAAAYLPKAVLAARSEKNNKISLAWYLSTGGTIPPELQWWCLQVRTGVTWQIVKILPASERSTSIAATIDGAAVNAIAIRPVDRVGGYGSVTVFQITK